MVYPILGYRMSLMNQLHLMFHAGKSHIIKAIAAHAKTCRRPSCSIFYGIDYLPNHRLPCHLCWHLLDDIGQSPPRYLCHPRSQSILPSALSFRFFLAWRRVHRIPKRSFIARTSACTRLKFVAYPGWISSLKPLISSRTCGIASVFFRTDLVSSSVRSVVFLTALRSSLISRSSGGGLVQLNK